MVIRKKMFIIISAAFVGILVIFALSGVLVLRGFETVEDQDVRENVLRAGGVFSSTLDNLGVKVHDWSAWDDTYVYILDYNEEYVESNLASESLQSLGINMILFIDLEGRLVYGKSIDTNTLEDVPIPESLLPYLQNGSPLIQYADLEGVQKGLISLPEGLLMIVARPIVTSKREGPAHGTLMFAQFIDSIFIEQLSRTIDFPLSIEPYVSAKGEDFAQAIHEFEQGEVTAVISIDQQTIAGFTTVPGVRGQPEAVLRAVMDRNTLALGQNTILIYLAFMFVTLSIISFGMWFLIDKFVLSRMTRLTQIVSTSSRATDTEILLPGNDEFSNLASVINALTTELKRSVQAMAEAKAKDEAILASIGDGLGVADEKGKLIYLNVIGQEILGGKANEGGHESWQKTYGVFDAITLEPYPAEQQPLYLATRGKVSVKVPMFIRNGKHPEGLFIEVTATPIVGNGKTIGGVAIFRDMSKERAVDKAKTEFVSLASHQLRTPLTSINWYTEMIMTGDAGEVTEKQKKYLQAIYTGNQRMVELVNSLLNVSRLELGTFVIEPVLVDFPKIAQSAIDEQQSQVTAKHIQLFVAIEKDMPRVHADPKLVRMVVQNLLSNAIKYTPDGGKVEFSGKTDETKKNLLITVKDTGCGIPDSQQHMIFTKLFRADNARQIDAEGTGLGLYIVKSIVQHSGGHIRFESKEGAGTTFYVTIPVG